MCSMSAKLLVLASVLATGCITKGSGTVIEETRPLDAFSRVDSSGSIDVKIDKGETSQAIVTADDNLMPMLETVVMGDTLKVRMNGSYVTSSALLVRVTTPTLEAVDVSGSGNLKALTVDTETFTVDISGSGSVVTSGQAQSLAATLSGSGRLDASALPVKSARLAVSGSGSAKVQASDELDASVSGSGSVRYGGSPEVTKSVSGSGRVAPL